MRISVLTPSNGRPDQLELCRRYVERQTFEAFEHVVVDAPRGLAENLREGLQRVQGDAIAIFEDDDWYHPTWLERVAGALELGEIVGERVARYYHVPTGGYWENDLQTERRSSLCATAFRRELTPLLSKLLHGGPFIDVRFWNLALQAGRGFELVSPWPPGVVGIKGLGGTPGIGRGHDPTFYRRKDSHDRRILRVLVGDEDATRYLELVGMAANWPPNGGHSDAGAAVLNDLS